MRLNAVSSAFLAGFALFAANLSAATLSVRLVATPLDTVNGIYSVDIQALSQGTPTGDGAGGVSNFQFDILSDGTLKSIPTAGTGPNSGKVAVTWSPAINNGGFSKQLPSRIDATAALNPAYVGDGDLDAPGGNFFDTGAFTNTAIGLGSYATIATETWTLTNPSVGDSLSLYLVGPSLYYDFGATASNFQRAYDSVNVTGVVLPATVVPEPATFALACLTVPALAYAIRRRKAA